MPDGNAPSTTPPVRAWRPWGRALQLTAVIGAAAAAMALVWRLLLPQSDILDLTAILAAVFGAVAAGGDAAARARRPPG